MNKQPQQEKWAFWKQQAPMLLMVFSFIAFMNAKTPEKASLFGMLAAVGIAWQIYRQRSSAQRLGEPMMELGRMYPQPPARMRPWHMLGVGAFALLGLAIFFSMSDANLPARLGFSILTFGITGAWLSMVSRRLRLIGALILGLGFLLGGAGMVWEAVTLVSSETENAPLNAVRWGTFGGFMLLLGIVMVLGILGNKATTPIYEQGIAGPHGFVPWQNAERLELTEIDGQPVLAVGAYRGWTIWIDVPSDRRDALADFVSSKRVGSQAPAASA